jgi:hypothetical protein
MEAQLDTYGDAAVLRVEASTGGATAATGAFRGAVSIDPGNLLVSDVAGPPAGALQVCTCSLSHAAVRGVCARRTVRLGEGYKHRDPSLPLL